MYSYLSFIAGMLVSALAFGIYLYWSRRHSSKPQQATTLPVDDNYFHLIADSAPVMIWMSGLDKLCNYFNQSWLNYTGRSLEQEMGNGWAEGVHPDDFERCLEIYTSSFDAREKFSMEYRLKRFDGDYRTILDNGVPRYDADGKFLGYIGSCIDISAQLRLEEFKQRMVQVLNTSAEAIISINENDQIIQFNQAAEKLFGYTNSDIIGRNIRILFPETAEGTYSYILDFKNSSEQTRQIIKQDKFLAQRKNGSTFPVDISLSKSVYLNKITITAIMLDMTEQLRAETLLRSQNTYLTALHDTALGLMNRLDKTILLEAIMNAAAELIGTPNCFIDMVLPDEACLELSYGIGIYTEYIGYRKQLHEGMSGQIYLTGKPLMINDYPNWDKRSPKFLKGNFHAGIGVPLLASSQVVGVIGVAYTEAGKQFTEAQLTLLVSFAELASIALDNALLYDEVRHHAEDLEKRVAERTLELGYQKHQIEIILQNVADAIIFTDPQGAILYVNPAWERLTGYTSAEVLGQNPRLLRSGATPIEVHRGLWQTITAGKIWHGEVQNKRKSGAIYDTELIIVPVQDKQESIQYYVGVQRDITESLKLQAQRVRFVGNAAHELRTPLTNFKTRIYLTRKQPEKLEHNLDILQGVVDHMTHLVNDLLDLSRFESGVIPLHLEMLDLTELISETIEMVKPQADNKNIRIISTLPKQTLELVADNTRIQQVLTNLLANAIHYTDEGGLVELLTEIEPAKRFVIIQVKDNGIGISEDNLTHIFQPFYRVDDKKVGTGLGLVIAKEIIERHNGEISVTSTFGRGTCFTIKLPFNQTNSGTMPDKMMLSPARAL